MNTGSLSVPEGSLSSHLCGHFKSKCWGCGLCLKAHQRQCFIIFIFFNHGWGAGMWSMSVRFCLHAMTHPTWTRGCHSPVYSLSLCVHRMLQDIRAQSGDSSKQLYVVVPSYCLYSSENVHFIISRSDTSILHSNWDSPVLRISANNSWVICTPCRPLAFLFNLLGSAACSFINNTHRHVC